VGSNTVFDLYQRLMPRRVTQYPVVIVDIDDASLAALGRWPWPRTRLARLIEATHRLGVLAVGLDILLPESDLWSPHMLLTERPDVSPALQEALAQLPSNDTILVDTLRRTPSVVARAGVNDRAAERAVARGQTSVYVHGNTALAAVQAYDGHITNLAAIEAVATGRGYLNALPDADGVLRVVPLVVSVHGTIAPTLALELLRVIMGAQWYSIHGSRRGIQRLEVGQAVIPTDAAGQIRLYFSPTRPERYVSALRVLQGNAEARDFAQKVAIIGVTGIGTTDIMVTPVAPLMYGVEVQAQIIENILAASRLQRPPVLPWLELGLFCVAAIALITWLPQCPLRYSLLGFLGGAVVVCAASFGSFLWAGWLIDPAFPIAANIPILAFLLTAGLAVAEHKRRDLAAALEEERLARSRMAGELQAARDIQMGMLPDPGAIAGLPPQVEFYAMLEPAAEVGGDLYDAFMIDAQHFFFLIGDVSGKGVPASLFMALSKTLCKSAALREHVPLDTLISRVNAEISRDNPAVMFVTAVFGILDVRTGKTELCIAGHDAPILLRPGEPPRSLDSAGGPPLCVLEDFPYPAEPIQLQPGDALLLITDGVTEAQDAAANLYGRARAMAYLAEPGQAHRSAAALCEGLYADVRRFASGAPPSDDITIMALRFTAPP
jgi:serine phosphatase RsbU (regulator of sigma subunit)/CHASE2 domain-containing sensor protein